MEKNAQFFCLSIHTQNQQLLYIKFILIKNLDKNQLLVNFSISPVRFDLNKEFNIKAI